MGRETTRITVSVDREVAEEFREFTVEKKGRIRGEMGRLVEKAMLEYMDHDRYARIEQKQDEILELLEGGRSENAPQNKKKNSGSEIEPKTDSVSVVDRRINSVVAELPNDAKVSKPALRAIIQEAAGVTSDNTIRKYERLLRERSHVFPHPVQSENEFFTGEPKFAMKIETDSRIKPEHVLEIVEVHEERLGENWYLDAIRENAESYFKHNTLKYEAAEGIDATRYRTKHDLERDGGGDGIGFQ